MKHALELARLNLVLEMATECAGLREWEALVRTVAARLRWIIEFENCDLVLTEGDAFEWLQLGARQETFSLNPLPRLSAPFALVAKALSTAAPASTGSPISTIAYPFGDPVAPKGVLCLCRETGFTHRELRLVHHICAALGAVLNRIKQEQVISAQCKEAIQAEERAQMAYRAKEEAAVVSAAKDSFMAMLGHELRNPLAPILSATLLLSRELEGKPLSRVKIIERQAKHLDRLVSDLLDVSRITSGKVTLNRTKVDFKSAISQAVEMARPGIEKKGQKLVVKLTDEPLMVTGDETRLTQVLSNLLNNASVYSATETTITVTGWQDFGEVVISIEDQGIGMSAETISKVFTLYVQGQQSKHWSPGGLGLGLAVSRALMELHGGTVEATSAGEGFGSQLTVRLPEALRETDSPTPATETSQAPLVTTIAVALKLLVVDDNVDAADFLAELLRGEGHEVCVAYGPLEALATVQGFTPDAAILDIGMPHMDGHELAASLRKLPALASMRLFALSGYGQDSDRERSRLSGFERHLVKPAKLCDLVDAFQNAA